jgi:hypothetical protein
MTKEEFFMTQALLNGPPTNMESRSLAPPKRSFAVGDKTPPRPPPLRPWPDDPSMTELMGFAVAAVSAGVLHATNMNIDVIRDDVLKLHQEFRKWYRKQEKAA